MSTSSVKLAYSRLETDDEFITRVKQKYRWWSPWSRGTALDDVAWDSFKMQRKLVVVYP